MESNCKYIDIFSIVNKKMRFCLIFVLFCTLCATAQKKNAAYTEYIARYQAIALDHQARYGIPASITLAQGLLESNAGRSYLARRGNNHFGIKCHNWQGEHVEYDDTLAHACYRKYESAEHSFEDHARFLKGRRYAPLYELDVNDYAGWAAGLRKCGYAEDEAYPAKLVNLIEQYELYLLAGQPQKQQEQPDAAEPPERHEEVTPPVHHPRAHPTPSARVAASFDND